MSTRLLTAMLCALLRGAAGIAAEPALREFRQHYAIVSPGGLDDYSVTSIVRSSAARQEAIVLIENARGEQFRVLRSSDFEKHRAAYEIRDPVHNESVRLEFVMPMSAKTLSGIVDEAHRNPQIMDAEVPLEIYVSGNRAVSGLSGQWKDPAVERQWRAQLRQMITPSFLEHIEVMQTSGLFALPMLEGIDFMLANHLLYRAGCGSAAPLRAAPAAPDCAFDAHMGFACSDRQRERAAKNEALPY